jgi:cellulose synthase/poly-beta-1,6-N-acetylglucosamine synthase-like glycosyltransferase
MFAIASRMCMYLLLLPNTSFGIRIISRFSLSTLFHLFQSISDALLVCPLWAQKRNLWNVYLIYYYVFCIIRLVLLVHGNESLCTIRDQGR